MTRALRFAVRSDRGLVRGNNEDSVYAGPRLLAIADGMGGHAAGEVASKLVISAMEHLDEDRPLDDVLAALRDAVLNANAGIADEVRRDSELEGMGTTLTALRFVGSQVGLVHVGDSRAYLLRAADLAQITHDDTYVQSLVDAGRLTADEAAHHPRKSVILRALTGTEVDPDVSIREAMVGDRYLLCSDGLSDVVSTTTLAETLADGDPQECADRLVELALRGGGPDNVTCIVADVVEADDGDDVPVIGGAFIDAEAPAPPSADDSPAQRAARMTQPSPTPGPPAHVERRRRIWRPVWALILVVVLGGAAAGTWVWTQQQYFVGRDGDSVAIFKGVDTQVGPVKFFRVARATDVQYSTLPPVFQSRVDNGISVDSLAGAETTVEELRASIVTATPSSPAPGGSIPGQPTVPTTPAPTVGGTSPRRSTAPSSSQKQISARPKVTPTLRIASRLGTSPEPS